MTHILLDIEALGRRPGSAPIELAAIAYDPDTGEEIDSIHFTILPHPFFSADLDTLAWHRKQGTVIPAPDGKTLSTALDEFSAWATGHKPEAFWSWGSTYDFPLLQWAFDALEIPAPWKYWQCRCARTLFHTALPGHSRPLRPHRALEDCRMALADLLHALSRIRA